jgi:hypothetical protein
LPDNTTESVAADDVDAGSATARHIPAVVMVVEVQTKRLALEQRARHARLEDRGRFPRYS